MENQNNRSQNGKGQNPKDGKRNPRKLLDEGPKFNYFWVYAIIFLFIIISFNLSFFQENVKESNMPELKELMKQNDVDKIVVVNEKVAEVFLKQSALTKPQYKDISHTRFGSVNSG